MDIDIASFDYRKENYRIDVYAILEDGSSQFLTGISTEIE